MRARAVAGRCLVDPPLRSIRPKAAHPLWAPIRVASAPMSRQQEARRRRRVVPAFVSPTLLRSPYGSFCTKLAGVAPHPGALLAVVLEDARSGRSSAASTFFAGRRAVLRRGQGSKAASRAAAISGVQSSNRRLYVGGKRLNGNLWTFTWQTPAAARPSRCSREPVSNKFCLSSLIFRAPPTRSRTARCST